MKKRHAIVWIVLAFLLGVVVCHLFYYSNSFFTEKKLKRDIDKLKKEYIKTQKDIDKIDSLLNQMR